MSNEQPDTLAAGSDAPSAGMKAKLPLIALVAVGLAIGAGTGAAVVGPMVAKTMGKTSEAHVAESADAPAEGHEAAPAEGAKGAESAVHLMENLVLNPAGSGGSRFLLLSVAIETSSSTVEADM